MATEEENQTRYRAQIDALIDMAAPPPGSGRTGQGALAAYFNNFIQNQRNNIHNNSLSEEDLAALTQEQRDLLASRGTNPDPGKTTPEEQDMVNRIIGVRLDKEKERVAQQYMNGVAQKPTEADAGATQTVTEVARVMGFGEGLMGWVAGMVAKIPVVGEFALAGIRVVGSAFNSLLGSVGLGDESAGMIGFPTALQQVRDERAFANGVNAVGSLPGVNTSQLVEEIRRGEGTNVLPTAQLTPIKDGNGKLIEGKNRKELIEKMPTLTVDGKEDEAFKKLKNALTQLPPEGNYMLVQLPENGEYAIASGKMSEDGTKLVPDTLYTMNAEGKLAPKSNDISTQPLQTERSAIVRTAFNTSISQDRVQEGTLSDDMAALKQNMDERGLGQGLSSALGNNPEVPPGTEGMKRMLVQLSNGGFAVASGTFNEKTNQFTIARLTVEKPDGTLDTQDFKPASQPPLSLRPGLLGAEAVEGTQFATLDLITRMTLTNPGLSETIGKELGRNSDVIKNAVSQLDPAIGQEKLTFMVVTMPGGAKAVVAGEYDAENKTVVPKLLARLNQNGQFSAPEQVSGPNAAPLEVNERKTELSSIFPSSGADFGLKPRPVVPEVSNGRGVSLA